MGKAHLLNRDHQVKRESPATTLLVVFAKHHDPGYDVTDEVVEKVSGVNCELSVRWVHFSSRSTVQSSKMKAKNPISLSKKQGLCIQFIATSNLGLMDHDFYIIFSYIIDFSKWTTELIRTKHGEEIGSGDSS